MRVQTTHPSQQAAVLALACASALAGANPPPGLTRVEPGVADVDALRTSFRLMPQDFRQPLGFDQVFSMRDAAGRDRFARINGAVTAVFPQSEYVRTGRGVVPLVPAGTVYYIGKVPKFDDVASAPRALAPNFAPPTSAASPAGSLAVDNRAAVRALSASVPGASESLGEQTESAGGIMRGTGVPAPGMLSDESFRRVRTRQLLMAAASASESDSR